MFELSKLNLKTKLIENLSIQDLKSIDVGFLIIYATWSGPAIAYCSVALNKLNEINFTGTILLINIDTLPFEFQTNVLGHLCHGWGEIFEIANGEIIKMYVGKESSKEFMNSFE